MKQDDSVNIIGKLHDAVNTSTVNHAHTTVLVTGAAGFIGSFLAKRLVEDHGFHVVGFDNCNDYYDTDLKKARLAMIRTACENSPGSFEFVEGNLADSATVNKLFDSFEFDVVINLAAQAGVRYSIDHPHAYIESNIVGFFNVLESCRAHSTKHFVYASSSSVYGQETAMPYSEDLPCNTPVSLYAATKRSDELMAYAYSSIYKIPCTGLRFFTVYGPMGRPDMAYFKFTDKAVHGEVIQLYNQGNMERDFTYIDDIVTGIVSILIAPPPSPNPQGVPSRIYNIGNSSPVTLLHFVETLERVLIDEGIIDRPLSYELLPMQPGDVLQTFADVHALEHDFGFRPQTSLDDGLRAFARWYKTFYVIP